MSLPVCLRNKLLLALVGMALSAGVPCASATELSREAVAALALSDEQQIDTLREYGPAVMPVLVELYEQGDDNDKLAQLQSKLSSPVASRHLQRYVLAEQHFFSLLWSGKYNEAMAYAQRMAEHFADFPLVRATWLEHNGDAAFLGGMENIAGQAYRDSLQADAGNNGAMVKLSDLAFLAGDSEGERHYREAVYGTLHK